MGSRGAGSKKEPKRSSAGKRFGLSAAEGRFQRSGVFIERPGNSGTMHLQCCKPPVPCQAIRGGWAVPNNLGMVQHQLPSKLAWRS